MTADQKRAARLTYRQAREALRALRKRIRKAKGKERKSLRAGLPKAESRVESARIAWKDLIERERVARVPRAPRARARALRKLDVPEPTGFEWVKRPRDFYRHVIDPGWKPPPAACVMLGKYLFHTFQESKGNVEALIVIRIVGNSVTEPMVRMLLSDYFDQQDVRVYWGNVRVLALDKHTRAYHRDKWTVRISTDHRRIKGMIHPSDLVYGGPYGKENGGGRAQAAKPTPMPTSLATTDQTVHQASGEGK